VNEVMAARDAAEIRLAEMVLQARLMESHEARRMETISPKVTAPVIAKVTPTDTLTGAEPAPSAPLPRVKSARKPRDMSGPSKKRAEPEQEAVKWWLPTFKARSRS
jgi:hypothetical protein